MSQENITDPPSGGNYSNVTDTESTVTVGALLNVTTNSTPGPYYGCEYRDYDIVYSIVASICIIFGILYTFFGYRFFKAIMFLTGFIFCTVMVYLILKEHNILPPEGVIGCAVGAGVLFGLVTMLIQHIGLFLTGFCLGLSFAAVALLVVEQFTNVYSIWISLSVLLVLGVLVGLLGLRFQKIVTVVGTSIIGGGLVLGGADYFVEMLRLALYLWDRVIARPSEKLCWFSWLVLAFWPVLTLTGAMVQWKFTGQDVDHRIVFRRRREPAANVPQSRVKEKRETQQTRYRHLYQARRVKGDVISQTFLQSIESKLSPAMQSLTALNTEPSNEEESTATTTLTHLT